MNLPEALLDQRVFPHETEAIKVLETHMSWVFLTGAIAYKVKKPVCFSFVDLTALAERARLCQRELVLNKVFAPDLYLDVVPIVITPKGLRVAARGSDLPASSEAILDWAVKMRQFPIRDQCSEFLKQNALTADHLKAFGKKLAEIHQHLEVCSKCSTDAHIADNVDTLLAMKLPEASLVQSVHAKTHPSLAHHASLMLKRLQSGSIKRCHGDLHLNNLVMLNDEIVAFDCLEFSDALATTDVWADVAFLFMDLCENGHDPLAYAFINAYLDISADYEGAILLRFYAAYRAAVRAKVEALRARQNPEHSLTDCTRYLAWADDALSRPKGNVVLTHGLSGSGKSYWSDKLSMQMGLIRIRSDVIRKSQAGLNVQADSASKPGGGLYTRAKSAQLYRDMAELAVALADEGEGVVIDAASLNYALRERVRDICAAAGVACHILSFQASETTLRKRIRQRVIKGGDPSEADEKILEWQLSHQETFRADEEIIRFDTEHGTLADLSSLIESARQQESG